MSDHQIPALIEDLLDWMLQVPTGIGLALEQITAPCVMTMAAEGIAHSAAVFTGDKDSHQ
jgi:peptide deformylase